MRSFQKSGRFKQILQSKVSLMFLGALIIFFAFSLFGLVSKMEETSQNRKIAEEKLRELEKTRDILNSDIVKLKTTEGQEEILREKYGVGKEGESMILVVEDKNSKDTEAGKDNNGFFSFLKNLFK